MPHPDDHPHTRRPDPQVETVTPREPVFHPPQPLPVWVAIRLRQKGEWTQRREFEGEAVAWSGQCVLVAWPYNPSGRDPQIYQHWIDSRWIRHRSGIQGTKARSFAELGLT